MGWQSEYTTLTLNANVISSAKAERSKANVSLLATGSIVGKRQAVQLALALASIQARETARQPVKPIARACKRYINI